MRFRTVQVGVDDDSLTVQSRVAVVCDSCDLAITGERPGTVWSSLEGNYLGSLHKDCGGYDGASWTELDEFLFAVLNPLIPSDRREEAVEAIKTGPI